MANRSKHNLNDGTRGCCAARGKGVKNNGSIVLYYNNFGSLFNFWLDIKVSIWYLLLQIKRKNILLNGQRARARKVIPNTIEELTMQENSEMIKWVVSADLRGKKKVDDIWVSARTKEGAKKTAIEGFKLFGITKRQIIGLSASKLEDVMMVGHRRRNTKIP